MTTSVTNPIIFYKEIIIYIHTTLLLFYSFLFLSRKEIKKNGNVVSTNEIDSKQTLLCPHMYKYSTIDISDATRSSSYHSLTTSYERSNK